MLTRVVNADCEREEKREVEYRWRREREDELLQMSLILAVANLSSQCLKLILFTIAKIDRAIEKWTTVWRRWLGEEEEEEV